jgi:hypothetical protein
VLLNSPEVLNQELNSGGSLHSYKQNLYSTVAELNFMAEPFAI